MGKCSKAWAERVVCRTRNSHENGHTDINTTNTIETIILRLSYYCLYCWSCCAALCGNYFRRTCVEVRTVQYVVHFNTTDFVCDSILLHHHREYFIYSSIRALILKYKILDSTRMAPEWIKSVVRQSKGDVVFSCISGLILHHDIAKRMLEGCKGGMCMPSTFSRGGLKNQNNKERAV